jgi:hypothetical protein
MKFFQISMAVVLLGLAGSTFGGDVLVYRGEGGYLYYSWLEFGVATGKTIVNQDTLPSDLSPFDCVLLPANGYLSPAFSGATLTALNAYVHAGGRIIAIGDNSNSFTDANAAMNGLATYVGADLHLVNVSIDFLEHVTTNIYPSAFTNGVSSLAYAYTSQVAVSVGPNAHALAGTAYTDTPFIGVDKVGSGIFFLLGDLSVFVGSVGYTDHDNGILAENFCDLVSFDIEVAIDIKFCNDPNAFNCKKKGVLPVTIFGTDSFDVADIDVNTLKLCTEDLSVCTGGPRDYSIVDRGDPTSDLGAAQCALLEVDDGIVEEQDYLTLDGYLDLDAVFEASEVKDMLGTFCSDVKGATSEPLVITGTTLGGATIISVPIPNLGTDQLWKVNK